MARSTTPAPGQPHPGRSLAAMAVIIAILVGACAALGVWKPRLGLDLQGGTSVTLTARTTDNATPTRESMAQALEIIRSRVNGAGVAEAEVSIQGDNNIVVQVPNVDEDELVGLVAQTAELQFRPVLVVTDAGRQPEATATTAPTPSTTATPTGSATPSAAVDPNGSVVTPETTATPAPRALTSDLLASAATPTASSTPTPSVSGTPTPSATPAAPVTDQVAGSEPTEAQIQELLALDCDNIGQIVNDPNASLVTCDTTGTARFILAPADVVGTDISDATAGIPQGGVAWEVQLEFTDEGADKFYDSTVALSQLSEPQNSFAIVLDGRVVSYPRVTEPIPGGQAVITGQFTQAESTQLANVLKYGALPLAFDVSEVTTVSPTLGTDQLRAGLIAGALGLLLVVLYTLLYYRALGLVVTASLAVAGLITYLIVCILGETIGFTLTLAGIAGLIVAIGITADSFVVYFERLRDEVRDGRSIRASAETGWARAKHTILASDAVSFMAAFFLYVFSVGGVRGFAFTLGLTTLVDILVVFMFTHPMVSALVRTKFFGTGHPLSGLNPDRLGAPKRQPGASVRGAAPIARRKSAAATGTAAAAAAVSSVAVLEVGGEDETLDTAGTSAEIEAEVAPDVEAPNEEQPMSSMPTQPNNEEA